MDADGEAQAGPLLHQPDKFILYRILGNDLPPLHAPMQTETNLRFTLENETDIPGCERRYVLNRIVDPETEDRLRALLDSAQRPYFRIPFDPNIYKSLKTSGERLRYSTNINGARNAALSEGLNISRCVLPFDGQTYFDAVGWADFRSVTDAAADTPYFVVPMHRVISNDESLNLKIRVDRLALHGLHEPQVAFTLKSDLWFNTQLVWGHMDKCELLIRLGVPGPWDRWGGTIRKRAMQRPSRHLHPFTFAGYVIRLSSGNAEGDKHLRAKVQARNIAILRFIQDLDARFQVARSGPQPGPARLPRRRAS